MKKILLSAAIYVLGLDTAYGMSDGLGVIGRDETKINAERNMILPLDSTFPSELLVSRDAIGALVGRREDQKVNETAMSDYQQSLRGRVDQLNVCSAERILEFLGPVRAEFEEIISERDRTVQELMQQITVLSHSSVELEQAVRVYDGEIQRRNREITRARDELERISTTLEPLVTERQFSRTMQRVESVVNRQLRGSQDLMMVDTVDRVCEDLRTIFESMMYGLQEQHDRNSEMVMERYQRGFTHLTEAYEGQIATLRDVITVLTIQNEKTLRKTELKISVERIFIANPSLRVIFDTKAQEVVNIADLFERREQVERLYDKFKLFSDLYGREDLGVSATSADLTAVKNWLDRTHIDVVLRTYGSFTFPAPCGGYHNEEGGDCPVDGRWHSFAGKDMGAMLHQAKERLEAKISELGATSHVDIVQEKLNSIFQNTSAADDNVSMSWVHTWFWGHRTNVLTFYKNGVEEGHFFHEYGGGFWKELRGFCGSFSGKFWVPWESGDARDVWNSLFVTRFNSDLKRTSEAIKQRAILLFDFETNPKSELNNLLRQAGQTPISILHFPITEVDALIKQHYEFVKASF